ncbi:DUF4097 family beta strand repeat-containing protein [Fodinibius salsisoli]|uniref:DUF4097 family beta strand repeat protein n=1 Tax=Fodinibius salsisoli TaxID=2820877 RepID=A0ABT3PRD9_9BACT|nr:DUF4097 family beta strand repeat-containing protein [Fodinibius salsisoli]MCW9708419.1 DUF4097 family beta strand repeat protein [Fodinibius salsisoli]
MYTRTNYLFRVALAFFLSLVITAILIVPSKATANGHERTIQDSPYRVESFTLSGKGTLDVQTSGGHITVTGSSSNTVEVEMYVRKNGKVLTPADTDLSDWHIDISQSGQSIRAIAKREGNGWNWFGSKDKPSISFVIYTPKSIDTDLNTSGGHIEVRGLSGNQLIKTSGGHLELGTLTGTVNARTSGGHITVSDVQANLNARTSGGHIDAENSEGNLTFKTSGGHISLENVAGTVEAKTSGGSIEADLITIGEFVDLKTSGGNINITVPTNIGLNLDLKGSFVSSNLQNFSGKAERNEIEGQINGGGPSVSARTSGGTVSLAFK